MAHDAIIIKKKKVVGHGGHHGGSWKVAYADFVTAMMAFFMVMWIMGLSDDNKAMIQGYFNDPAGFMKNPPRTKDVVSMPGASKMSMRLPKSKGTGMGDDAGLGLSEDEEARMVKDQVNKRLNGMPELQKIQGHVVVTASAEGLLIEFLEDVKSVFFESGSAKISAQGKKTIKAIAPFLRDTGRFMVVEGHTDRKPYAGTAYTNWELSSDRASSLRKELAANNIPNNRFREVRGFADTKLRFPDKPYAVANRRVSLLMPWGKKAAVGNSVKQANQATRKSLAPIKPGHFNLFDKQPREPHL